MTPATTPRSIYAASGVFAGTIFVGSFWRWWSFQYATFDLAFYVQSLWLALRCQWHGSLLDVPLLGNHAEPIVYLALPLFGLCPHPMLLVALQTFALASMPVSAWRICQRLGLDSRSSVLLAIAVVLTPAAGFVGLHEFHPEAFAAPLVLLMVDARLAKRYGLFLAWAVALIASKENLALLMIAFCLVHALEGLKPATSKSQPGRPAYREILLWSGLPGLIALVWLTIYARWISPSLNGGAVDFLELYSHLGRSGSEILSGFFLHPQVVLSALAQGLVGGNLVWGLALPFLGFSLLRPKWLLIGLPLIFQHLLSWRASEWSLRFHYAAPLIPLFWVACAEALARIRHPKGAAYGVLGACICCQIWFGPVRDLAHDIAEAPHKFREHSWKMPQLSTIPESASVTAGIPYLSHLATRPNLYSLHHTLKGLKTLSRATYSPPASDFVLIDYEDASTFNQPAGYYHPTMHTSEGNIVASSDLLLNRFLSQAPRHHLSANALALYSPPRERPASTTSSQGVEIAPQLQLMELKSGEIPASGSLVFDLRWQVAAQRESFVWADLVLTGQRGRWQIVLGACALEVRSGEATEQWVVILPPDLPAGQYALSLLFYERIPIGRQTRELPLGVSNLRGSAGS